jgi:hypothetical protein
LQDAREDTLVKTKEDKRHETACLDGELQRLAMPVPIPHDGQLMSWEFGGYVYPLVPEALYFEVLWSMDKEEREVERAKERRGRHERTSGLYIHPPTWASCRG